MAINARNLFPHTDGTIDSVTMQEVQRLGMFQKVNDWLTDKSDRFARGGDANRTANAAYYASSEAEQAYGGMRKTTDSAATSDTSTAGNDTGRTAAVDRFNADANDKYGGRVPYRSQRDVQAEADTQRQQMEDQARRQQSAQQQRQAQQFGRAPASAQAAFQQPQQQGNIVQFPGMIRGPEGNLYAHVEYVVLLRSRNECTKVIEYIKANASVFLNMEFIANDSERQRCVDMLSGAAYTLGCQLNKISQRGIYLISSPSVCVVIDPAMQKYATAPEAQSYIRPEYSGYGAGAQTTAYAAQPSAGGYATSARASGYGAQTTTGGYASDARTATYGTQQTVAGGYGNGAAVGARTAAYNAQQGGYAAGARAAAYGTPASAYSAQAGAQTGGYASQSGLSAAAPTGAYAAQSGFNAGAQTGAYAAQAAYSGAQTGAYPAQPAQSFSANAQTGAYAAQRTVGYATAATPPVTPAQAGSFGATPSASQPRRTMPTFGMQGAFTKSAETGTR